jgi:hypothetical protein
MYCALVGQESVLTYQVTEALIAIQGKRVVIIPRSAIVEITDRPRLRSFVDVVWKGKVYSVRRIDIETKTTQLASV